MDLKAFDQEKKSKKKIIIITSVILVAAIALVAVSYSLFQKQDEGIVADGTVKRGTSILKATSWSDNTAFRSSTYKSKIKNITFEDEINIRENKIEEWDISENEDGSIISYVVPNETEGYYDLYIGSNNYIEANSDMSFWFANFSYLETINGLELLDTSNLTNMSYMFYSAGCNASSFTMDLSYMDLSNVTDMSSMFSNAGSNASNFTVNLSNMDLSNVINMYCMFQNAGGRSEEVTIDLSNTDTSNVTNMSYMFGSVGGRAENININLSGFDTNSVTTMRQMFQYFGPKLGRISSSSVTLDLSSFDTSNVTNMREMFREALNYTELVTIDVSSFDTSNVTDMWGMFYDLGHNSTNLNFNITIRNKETPNYSEMFKYAACQEGALITVNYTKETSDLVDQMIATKSTNSNVVKGVQVD